MGGRTYQEHERGEEEEPEVVCLAVRERGFFEHPAVAHAGCSRVERCFAFRER